MKRFTIAIFSLTILAIFFVVGCLKMTETEIKPSDEQAIISYEQQETEDEAVIKALGSNAKYFNYLKSVSKWEGIQTRIPYNLDFE